MSSASARAAFSGLEDPIADQAWVGDIAIVGPGILVAEGSAPASMVITYHETLWTVYEGNLAAAVRKRTTSALAIVK